MRYIEEWWEGGGNAGPCVEVILDGVEVATLVFMMYRDTPEGRKPMNMTVVDTGYGLERDMLGVPGQVVASTKRSSARCYRT